MSGGKTGRTITEAEAMRSYANELNVDNKQIVLEPLSMSTVHNALKTKELLLFSELPIFASSKSIQVIVITSSYHKVSDRLPNLIKNKKRSEIIFRSVFHKLENSSRTLSSLIVVGVDIERLDDLERFHIFETII
jgi:hypothetical protein